jgi:hypothetical protein
MHLQKQKEHYQIALNKLAYHGELKNAREADLMLAACFDTKLSTLSMEGREGEKMLELVSYWRLRLGCSKDVSPLELKIEAEYLLESWGHLSVVDIKNAIMLLTENKLDLTIPYVIHFSTLSMGQVLAAYEKYKAPIIDKVVETADDIKLREVTEPTIEEQIEAKRQIITLCHQHMKEGFVETFFNRMVYDFLRRTKRLVFNDAVIAEAKAYAAKKYTAWVASEEVNLKKMGKQGGVKVGKEEKEKMNRQFGVDYCLIWYFENNKLEDVLASITEKDLRLDKKDNQQQK